jgi:polyisoprenoid-binding protein YceI
MALMTVTRKVEGREVPTAGTYDLDPAHTTLGFEARHLMVTKVRGHFNKFGGELIVDEVPERSSATIQIEAASLDSGVPDRDAHLKSQDFLWVEKYPRITFRSTSLNPGPDGDWELAGELTIRDVTKPVTLKVDFGGGTNDPFGKQRIFLSATAELDREDWGMTWNMALEAGGVLVSKKIKADLEIAAIRRV